MLAGSLLGSGWMLRLRVTGTSMKPLIRSGSVLRIAPLRPSTGAPKRGDIVLFSAPSGRLLAHRIVDIQGESYLTKGDSSGEPDGLVGHRQLLGRVVGIDGLFFFPLDGPLTRRLGLFFNRHYPRLVRFKAALKARLRGTPRLAGEGS